MLRSAVGLSTARAPLPPPLDRLEKSRWSSGFSRFFSCNRRLKPRQAYRRLVGRNFGGRWSSGLAGGNRLKPELQPTYNGGRGLLYHPRDNEIRPAQLQAKWQLAGLLLVLRLRPQGVGIDIANMDDGVELA